MTETETVFKPKVRRNKPFYERALPWIAGVVLVAGIIAFVVVKLGNTGQNLNAPLLHKGAVDVSKVPKSVKLDPAARDTARKFILTAVARTDLRAAYLLAGPMIRQGQSLKEWMSGNIAVIPYPADAIDFAPMKVDFSYPKEVQIEVALLPKQGKKIRGQLFIMDLVKQNGHWLVNSWVPRASPALPNGSTGNGAGY